MPPLLLGRCYWMDENKVEAIKELNRALERAEGESDAVYLRLCLRALEAHEPEYSDRYTKHSHFMLSRLFSGRGQWRQAVRLVDEALAILGGDPKEIALWKFGVRNFAAGELQNDLGAMKELRIEVLAFIEADMQSHGQFYPGACGNLGVVAFAMGQFEESVGWFEKARKAERPDDRSQLRFLHGDALWRMHRRDEAVAAWREALAGIARAPDGKHGYVDALKKRLRAAEDGEDPPLVPVNTTAPATQPAHER